MLVVVVLAASCASSDAVTGRSARATRDVYHGVRRAMDPSSISAQIDRILHSRTLATKGQLRKLLQILHQHMNPQAGITSDLVIRELWPAETKTKRSSDVATEMNRLRHALATYYEEEGAVDPITISLPKRAGAAEGTREQLWIVAMPRGVQADRRRTVKVGIGIVALCAVTAIATYISIRLLSVHPPPQFGRLDGSILRIMDAEGKELWNKSFPEGFGPDYYYDKGLSSRIWFADIEGKGRVSVLLAYSPNDDQRPHSSLLICYSDQGKEKWRWTPGRDLPEMAGSPATYKILSLGLLKAAENKPARIVVVSQHDPWWPSQIAVLDAHGRAVSEYWHSGGLRAMILADLDGNGRQEIMATGVSEYDHQATLVVLDPDRVFGASKEVRPGFQIHGMGDAQERLRLLFPRSDLNRAMYQFNVAINPRFENGVLRLEVAECITPLGCRIWYEFDKDFRLIAAYAGGDEFRSAHARFYQNGKEAHTLSDAEQATFLKVRCLVGCKSEFVEVGKLVP